MGKNYKVIKKVATSIQLGDSDEKCIKEFMKEIDDLINDGWIPTGTYTRDVQVLKYGAYHGRPPFTDSHATYTQALYKPK